MDESIKAVSVLSIIVVFLVVLGYGIVKDASNLVSKDQVLKNAGYAFQECVPENSVCFTIISETCSRRVKYDVDGDGEYDSYDDESFTEDIPCP